MPKVAGHAQRPRPVQDTSPVIANKRRYTPIPGWNCADCKKSETPVRRHGPEGPRTLCNACGLRRAKRRKVMDAVAVAAAAAAGLPAPPQALPQKTRRRRSATATKRTQKPTAVAAAQPVQRPQVKENKASQVLSAVRQPKTTRKPHLQQTQQNLSQSNTSFHSASSAPREVPHRPSSQQSSAISPDELLHCSLVSTPVSLGPLVSPPVLARQSPSCGSLVSIPAPCTSPVSVSSGRPGTQLLLTPQDHSSLSAPSVSMPLAHSAPRSPVAQALPHPSAKVQTTSEPLCWRQNDVALFDSIFKGSPNSAHHIAHPLDCSDLLPSPVGVVQDVLSASPFDSYPTDATPSVPGPTRGCFDIYGDPIASLDNILTQSATANESSVLTSMRSASEDVQMQLKSLHALFADKETHRPSTNSIGGSLRIEPGDMIQLDKSECGNIVAFA